MGSKLLRFIFLVATTLVLTVAFTTSSDRFSGFAELVWSEVLWGQFVSITAMGLSCVLCCQRATSEQVGLVVHYFKMAGIYTTSISTQMIANIFRRRNDFYEHLVDEPVDYLSKATPGWTEMPVATVLPSLPFPAGRSIIKRAATYFHFAEDAAHNLSIKLKNGLHCMNLAQFYIPCNKEVYYGL